MSAPRQFYVYMHCRPDGSLFYIGKGSGRRSHAFTGRNQRYRKIVAQYRVENIIVSIVPCASEDEAFSTEIQLIKAFRVLGEELVNATDGGEGIGTIAGLQAAKARGTQLGGRRVSSERWAEIGSAARTARSAEAEKRAAELLPAIESAKAAGAQSLRQIAAALNARNIPTPRGGEWSAVQVKRTLWAARWYHVHAEQREWARQRA